MAACQSDSGCWGHFPINGEFYCRIHRKSALTKPFSLDCFYMHIFPKDLHGYVPALFISLFTCTHTHTQKNLFHPDISPCHWRDWCGHKQATVHLSEHLPSSSAGEVWSVLAHARHRDVRSHSGHSTGHSGAGHLLCQNLCSLQGERPAIFGSLTAWR